ncbi:hypothetical protein FGU71_01850 [Erythrobacter insulae]|uniref:SH3 domain-containing protein n=1 Tax=Erythrobacter insulae TaxID=2584124 RepID=A0A547P9A0_9SPHN|nr:hypothetical protein [Erythrobacter insulae]TRD10732.1 hypothetical protein FGU71_01850 [Erythrobacter insulae]
MSGTEVQANTYTVPGGILGLKGPVQKPMPGTLPLRGDLAHIALAGTHLAAHYVIPHVAKIGDQDTNLHLMPRDDSEITRMLPAGSAIEVLDVAGEWVWICVGPEGPSGYCKADCLAN